MGPEILAKGPSSRDGETALGMNASTGWKKTLTQDFSLECRYTKEDVQGDEEGMLSLQ